MSEQTDHAFIDFVEYTRMNPFEDESISFVFMTELPRVEKLMTLRN